MIGECEKRHEAAYQCEAPMSREWISKEEAQHMFPYNSLCPIGFSETIPVEDEKCEKNFQEFLEVLLQCVQKNILFLKSELVRSGHCSIKYRTELQAISDLINTFGDFQDRR